MNQKTTETINTQLIIRKIAEENGVTPAEVRQEMLAALREGFHNPDPQVQAVWKEIPCKGDMPTIEEFLTWAAQRVASQIA